MNSSENLEPWLRGILPELDPVIGHLLRSSQQIREDIASLTSAMFHVQHLAGSTDRLCTYLEGGQLTPAQLEALAAENQPDDNTPKWIAAANRALDRYEQIIRRLTPAQFGDIREVGRRRLPVTAIGLAIHIAEHGQRHAGQAITCQRLTKS